MKTKMHRQYRYELENPLKSPAELAERVEGLLNEGWTLYGNPLCRTITGLLIQALTRDMEVEVEE